jgi:hypothetical protein
MLEYKKMMSKEARADHALAKADAKFELKTKEQKLLLEGTRIEALQVEAGQRYEKAMDAADKEMLIGIAQCAAEGAAAGSGQRPWRKVASRQGGSRSVADRVLHRLDLVDFGHVARQGNPPCATQ